MNPASFSALAGLISGTTGLQAGALESIPLSIPEVQMLRERLETLNGGAAVTGATAAGSEAARFDHNMGEFMTILRNLDVRSPAADFMTESSEIAAHRKLANLIREMPQASRNRVEHAALYASTRQRLHPLSETPTLFGVANKDGDEVRGILEHSQLGRMETREILSTLRRLKDKPSREGGVAGNSEVEIDPHFMEWAQIFLSGGKDLDRLEQAAENYKKDKPLWSAQLFFLAGLLASQNGMPAAADYFLKSGQSYEREDQQAKDAAAMERFPQRSDYISRWNIHAAQAYFLAAQAVEGKPDKANEAYTMAAQSMTYNDPYFGMSDAMKLKWAFDRRRVELSLYRDSLAHLQSDYGFFLLSPTVRQRFFPKVWIETERAASESNLLSVLHLLDADANGFGGYKPGENLQMARAAWEEANSL